MSGALLETGYPKYGSLLGGIIGCDLDMHFGEGVFGHLHNSLGLVDDPVPLLHQDKRRTTHATAMPRRLP
jgi:hypothetical protein